MADRYPVDGERERSISKKLDQKLIKIQHTEHSTSVFTAVQVDRRHIT